MNSRLLSITFLFIAGLLAISNKANATHLRAGQITVVYLGGLDYEITVEVYTNTINTNVLFGGDDDWLDFGDGTRMLIPEQANTLRPELGEGIATAKFKIQHTYPGFQRYVISYSEPNRNEGVINIANSVNTRFYIETEIITDPFLGQNNSPVLEVPPIDRGCTGVAFFHNPGAYDPDEGDSLSYEMVVPFREKGTQVFDYVAPNAPKFYNAFNTGNELGTGPPVFKIDPIDGTITWDAPGSAGIGEYNIAFIVKEWKKKEGVWYSIGFVRRDMQIIIEDCNNDRPELEVPEDICVVAGTLIEEKIIGKDINNDKVKIEMFSQIEGFGATINPDNQFANQPLEVNFKWQTACEDVKEQPYLVVFKITDNGKPNLVEFKTWRITVVGPKPEWSGPAVPEPLTRSVNLDWDTYACPSHAVTMQVWRRVDSFAFSPDTCDTGMPESAGYTMIAELPIGTTNYKDTNGGKGLAVGAAYCYRLVALFPDPGRGESLVSEEVCIEPFPIVEPVIFRVSVDSTSKENGRTIVSWLEPVDINRAQIPELEYEVYRADGFTGADYKKISPRLPEPAPGIDTLRYPDEGFDTRDKVYNYRVVVYGNSVATPGTFVPIDTSQAASTVRVEAQSELKKIILTWNANVPWSNFTAEPHTIYRGLEGTPQKDMVPIAEVIPTVDGLTYTDEGTPTEPLDDTKTYSYFVVARGSYGNDDIKTKIAEPLENSSQIILAQPSDSLPPCKPELFVDITDCSDYLSDPSTCRRSSYTNKLSWSRPTGDCSGDISGYKIYRASEENGVYSQIEEAGIGGIVRDTFFIDNVPSLAYCYRVTAIDRSGNESEMSDPKCNDTCPYYELPNLFTPNADECNDRFSAFRPTDFYDEEAGEGEKFGCGIYDGIRCARFVRKVNLRVFNRWGKQVYEYESGDERSIYIDWDGRATDGSDLATGIYYYVAEVTFDTVNPKKRVQDIKGWVHLAR